MTSRLRTCSEDGDYAVFGGASSSEPDTDEMMDGRASGRDRRAARPAAATFHAGAAAAAASGIGTAAGDDWLFDIARAPAAADAAPDTTAVATSFQHPGCTGVAAVAVTEAMAATATTTTTTTMTTRTAAAAAAVVVGGGSGMDADIKVDDLLADFKAARELERQKQRQQQEEDDVQIERVSLASLGAGRGRAPSAAASHPCSSSSSAVRFVNALQPLPADDEPLLFSDGPPSRAPVAARKNAPPRPAAAAAAAARPAAPPVPSAAAATTATRPAPTTWSPSQPLPGSRTAVVGPGASAAYEDEALTFSRARRRPAAAEAPAAAAFRHPGM
jgi:hypothetical protein